MLSISEKILYTLAKRALRKPGNVSEFSAKVMASEDSYDSFRLKQISKIRAAAKKADISFADKKVMDLGCGSGVLTDALVGEFDARSATGIDVSSDRVSEARKRFRDERITFYTGEENHIPVEDETFDAILSFDVFEHLTDVAAVLDECLRVMKPGGGGGPVGTWGWWHPWAPHYWHVMPVPWAHIVFGERAFMKACRRIYLSDFYVPRPFELRDGKKDPNRYNSEGIPDTYVNKLKIRDFEKALSNSPFKFSLFPEPLRGWRALRPSLYVRGVREFTVGYLWVGLTKSNNGQGVLR